MAKKRRQKKISRGERRSSAKVKLDEIQKILMGGGMFAALKPAQRVRAKDDEGRRGRRVEGK